MHITAFLTLFRESKIVYTRVIIPELLRALQSSYMVEFY